MLEARTHGRSRFAKVASGKILFKWSSTGDYGIEFHGGARRRAGDLQFVRGGSLRAAQQKQGVAQSEFRVRSHERRLAERMNPSVSYHSVN